MLGEIKTLWIFLIKAGKRRKGNKISIELQTQMFWAVQVVFLLPHDFEDVGSIPGSLNSSKNLKFKYVKWQRTKKNNWMDKK